VWRFLHEERLTAKPFAPPSRTTPTSPASASGGSNTSTALTRRACLLSVPSLSRAARGRIRAARAQEDHDVPGLQTEGIVAPCVFDGPIDGCLFLGWVTQFLVPTLRPGDIVVLDNMGTHKGVAVSRAIRKSGAHLLFLPPNSPNLNPIEMAFAKLKTLLPKTDE
jgi:hypothetical protein